MTSPAISAIVPTIGRPASLAALLQALTVQTRRPDEVIVADGGTDPEIERIAGDAGWAAAGLVVRYLRVAAPNAVRQRQAAIAISRGSLLLLLDDDVVPEPECVAAMVACLDAGNAVAVCADFSNQDWPPPTMLWRWYLRACHGVRGREWQGRVIGPILRFGYNPVPAEAAPMDWLGTCNSLLRRDAYERAGGFSDFFLHRSTMNEDVDLGIKVRRQGRILLCPGARMAHLQAPGGRLSPRVVAEDDLYNRYCILRVTERRSAAAALSLTVAFLVIETLSGMSARVRGRRGHGFGPRLAGRLSALGRILAGRGITRA